MCYEGDCFSTKKLIEFQKYIPITKQRKELNKKYTFRSKVKITN
jgi:hypothetical protein